MRADASASIGFGHVMRCFALAQALRLTGATRITFLCASLPDSLEQMLAREEFEVVRFAQRPTVTTPDNPFLVDQRADAHAVQNWLAEQTAPQYLVVDHYGLDAVWEAIVRPAVAHILVIDDLANRAHLCDSLLDPGLQITEKRYDAFVPSHCRRLLGPRFALLRPEFAQIRERVIAAKLQDRTAVLIFAGGGDVLNATSLLLEAWAVRHRNDLTLNVVIGASHPCRSEIEKRCAEIAGVRLHFNTDRMAELLASARLFIGSAGGVSWERCCLGTPAVMFAIADNQSHNLIELARRRTGIALTKFEQIEPKQLHGLIERLLTRSALLARMSRRAAALVDGLGAVRAAVSLTAPVLKLREARPEDDMLAWPWRNHPSTRRFFRDPRALTLDEHTQWWARSLAACDRTLLIAQCGSRDVGVLRFDAAADDASAEVSIYIDPALTGVGLGTSLLLAGQRWVALETTWRRLDAEILSGNRASQAAFEAVGFHRYGARWIWECPRE